MQKHSAAGANPVFPLCKKNKFLGNRTAARRVYLYEKRLVRKRNKRPRRAARQGEVNVCLTSISACMARGSTRCA